MAEEEKGPTRDASGRFVPKADADAPAEDEATIEEQASAREDDPAYTEGTGKRPENETAMERVNRLASGDLKEGEWVEDISDTVAPSVGPKSVTFHHPANAPRENIDLDAMGHDKRRQVVGQSYGASVAKQATIYGIFVAIVVGLLIGGKILVDKADQPPDHVATQALWAQPDAPQHPPKPLE
jgi:hypothetical protein